MKFSTLRPQLQQAVATASRMIAARPTLPVLNNILLQTDQGQLRLSSTDLNLGYATSLPAKVEEQGAITVPARLLSEFLNTIPTDKVKFSLEGTMLHAQAGGYQASFTTMVPDEFPEPPKLKGEKQMELSIKALRQAIPRVVFATAADESRPALTGVLLQFAPDSLTMVAADGYRLAEYQVALTQSTIKEHGQLIIPAKALSELMKITEGVGGDETLSIRYDANQVYMEQEQTLLVSRLIVGQFPDYRQILPQQYQTKVRVQRSQLQSALRLASLFAVDNANIVQIRFSEKDQQLTIKASSAETGQNESALEAQGEGGDNFMAFNAKYVLDVLNTSSVDYVLVQLNDPLTPGAVMPDEVESEESRAYHYVVMPVRT